MAIAVCYSGCVRSFIDKFDNHKQFIYEGHDCDFYFSFWDHWGHSIRHSTLTDTELNTKVLFCYPPKEDYLSDDDKLQIINLCNPVDFEFEDYSLKLKQFEKEAEFWQHNNIRPNYTNTVSMFYKINRCNELVKKSSKKYDVVLRIRSDITFRRKLNFLIPEESTYYCDQRDSFSSSGLGINDMMGYGNQETLNRFCSTYNNLELIKNYMQTQPTARQIYGFNLSNECLNGINFKLQNLKVVSNSFTEDLYTINPDLKMSETYINKVIKTF